MNHEIKLGRVYRDVLTGFEGVAVGVVDYLTGCSQVLLQPKAKDGAFVDSHWLDVQRCRLDTESPAVALDNGATPGFDKPAPIR